MALQELALNGVSYGSLSGRDGKLSISWHQTVTPQGLRVILDWREVGGPPVEKPRQRGYGLLLVERLCSQGLKGNVEFAFKSAGLHATIEINLDPTGADHPGTI